MLRNVLIAVTLMCFWGCTKNQTNVEYGLANQELFYGNGDEPKSVDPHITTGSPENNIIIALFEGLVRKDHTTLEPKPAVAKSWSISDDGTVYTFALREDAKWSNGKPLVANDFVQSWKRALMPTLTNEYAYMMFYLKNAEAYYNGTITDFDQVGVKALNDHTLEVTLNYPAQFFLQVLDHHSYYPVPVDTIAQFGDIDDPTNPWVLPGNFVGNGPFVLSTWDINQSLVVTKSPTYWDHDNVRLNAVHYLPIDDQQAEERAFRSGVIHLTNTPQMDIEKIAVYRKDNPEALRVTSTYAAYYYEFNVNRPPLDDVRVRQAIAYAIDRQTLVKNVTKGGETVAYNFLPPDPSGFTPKDYFAEDVSKAQALLAEAGYPNGDGFPTFTILYNTHDNHRKVALAIQQMLKQNLNINVQIENKEWKVYIAAKKNLEHDMARAGWVADYLDPSNFFDILKSDSGNNDTGWKSAEYDALMRQITAEANIQKRYGLFEQASQLLAEEMPVVPLYYFSDINLVSPMVKNWPDNVLHYHPLKDVYLQQ